MPATGCGDKDEIPEIKKASGIETKPQDLRLTNGYTTRDRGSGGRFRGVKMYHGSKVYQNRDRICKMLSIEFLIE